MADTVQLSVTTGFKKLDSSVNLNVKLQPPEGGARQPSDIVCVIDISGSMGMEATIAGASGEAESHGLSLLDVAKHGVRTIAQALNAQDRLAVVVFNHSSEVIFPLRAMDEAGKTFAEEKLEPLMPGGGTSIWDGLEKGLDCLQKDKAPGRLGHVMFLTDGETQGRDTVIPKTMTYKEVAEGLPGSINTFGFGYNLDSRLLCDMAHAGMGAYSFIPDAGFVGTAFVNMMSQLLATMAQDVYITVEKPDAGLEIVAPYALGGWKVEDTGDFIGINVGSLQYGQSKDIVIPLKAGKGGEVAVAARYKKSSGETVQDLSAIAKVPGEGGAAADTLVEEQWCRCTFVSALQQTLENMYTDRTEEGLKACMAIVQSAAASIKVSSASDTPNVQALLEDVMGQSTEAVSRHDWYWKWGVHYLPSVLFAHKLQICNNFKDPGVQVYGGKLFQALRDEADDIFCNIPAPKPTVQRNTYSRPSVSNSFGAPSAPVSMAAYHNASAVCLDGSSLVRMAKGGQQRVADLAKGDRVLGSDGAEAEVLCLVRTACAGGRAQLVELAEDLRLTPYHPVFVGDEWRFPADLAEVTERPCEAVYSFVLQGAPAMSVGGVLCAAVGHGIEAGAAAHPYFATQRAVEDIARLANFKDGLVEIQPGSVVRDPATGLICGIAAAQ